MLISPEIQNLVDRIGRELEEIEFDVREGLHILQPIISNFPNNVLLTQFFASLSDNLLYVEISRNRIQITINRLSSIDVTEEEVLEAGEDLSMELGRAIEAKIEAKISARQIVKRLKILS